MPADAVDLAQVVLYWVVDAVEVGEAAGVIPPAWQEREGAGVGAQPGNGGCSRL